MEDVYKRQSFERGAIHNENIWPPVVIIVKDRNSGPRRFDDVFLGVHAPKNIFHREPGFFADVHEVRKLARAALSLRTKAKRERKR